MESKSIVWYILYHCLYQRKICQYAYSSTCMFFDEFSWWMPDPGEERPMVRRKNIPPPRPPPYIQQRPMSEAITRPPQKPQSESMVKAQMPYWYRPQFSREEAISFIRHLDPGSFIVRDSMTVRGGYAITIKISQEQVRQWRKMAEGMESCWAVLWDVISMYVWTCNNDYMISDNFLLQLLQWLKTCWWHTSSSSVTREEWSYKAGMKERSVSCSIKDQTSEWYGHSRCFFTLYFVCLLRGICMHHCK